MVPEGTHPKEGDSKSQEGSGGVGREGGGVWSENQKLVQKRMKLN